MSFSDNFDNGVNGDLLSARPGWSFLFGDDLLKVNASGQLSRATATAALAVWLRTDDSATYQTAKVDLLWQNSAGPCVLASGTSASNFNCYYLRSASTTGLRVYRITNGVQDAAAIVNITGLTNILNAEIRATVGGSATTLEVWQNGSQLATYSDSNAARKTSGRRGLVISTAAQASPTFDNYSDNYSPPVNLSITPPLCPFFEGVRQSSVMPVNGTYSGTVTSIEARLINVDAVGSYVSTVSGYDWSTQVASPTGNAYSFSFNGVPVGGPYRVQIRDSANPGTVVSGQSDRHVGAIIVSWGQSQSDRLFRNGAGKVTPASGIRAFVLQMADQTQPGAPTYISYAATPAQVGSGIAAAFNQWFADTGGVPILAVKCNFEGSSIDQWISDTGQRPSMAAGWYLWPGFATTMLNACNNQASLVMNMQGTADLGNWSTYAPKMDTLRNKFTSLLPGQNALFAVVPHQRSVDTNMTWNMRNVQYQKAVSGDPWRLNCWLLDWQMDGDTSPHQLPSSTDSTTPGTTGNVRGGTRIGRGWAKHLFNQALDNIGPQVVSADFVDGTRTAFDVTFDRDVKTPAGATTALPGHFASIDNSTFTDPPTNVSAALVGARTLRVTSSGSPFPAGMTRYDLLRGIPFSSDTGDAYQGPEADVETNFLSKVLTDTSSFDSARGMPAAPIMGSGKAVSQKQVAGITNGSGSAILRVRQA